MCDNLIQRVCQHGLVKLKQHADGLCLFVVDTDGVQVEELLHFRQPFVDIVVSCFTVVHPGSSTMPSRVLMTILTQLLEMLSRAPAVKLDRVAEMLASILESLQWHAELLAPGTWWEDVGCWQLQPTGAAKRRKVLSLAHKKL